MQNDRVTLSPADQGRLARWDQHLRSRHQTLPHKDDFLAFGKLSSLERLCRVLAIERPEHCAPLKSAMQELRKIKKAAEKSKATGGQRGPKRTVSVAADALPPSWSATLNRLGRERARLDAGGINFDDRITIPAAASISDMTWIVCAICQSCTLRAIKSDLSDQTIAAWLDDAEARGCKARGLSLQIGLIRRFVIAHAGQNSKLAKQLNVLGKSYSKRGRKEEKRKERFLLNNPTDIGEVWNQAEDLRAAAMKARPGTLQRQKLFLEAAVLAVSIVVPLRIGDLHRLVIGESISRSADAWSIRIETSKTGADYSRPELWPELTPFLDALLIEDSSGRDLWRGYHARIGTSLFSYDFGKTGLSGGWISDVWRDHVGCGAHIVRTLWHQLVWEGDKDRTWVALALCAQRNKRTAKEYQIETGRVHAARRGRNAMSVSRQRASTLIDCD